MSNSVIKMRRYHRHQLKRAVHKSPDRDPVRHELAILHLWESGGSDAYAARRVMRGRFVGAAPAGAVREIRPEQIACGVVDTGPLPPPGRTASATLAAPFTPAPGTSCAESTRVKTLLLFIHLLYKRKHAYSTDAAHHPHRRQRLDSQESGDPELARPKYESPEGGLSP